MITIIWLLLFSSSITQQHNPALPAIEMPVIVAAVQHEIESSDVSKRRPILLLDRTDNWLPPEDNEENLDQFPQEVRDDVAQQIEEKRVPKELRSSNKTRYSLASLVPPKPVLLHKASDFEKEYQGTAAFRMLVKELGKEPLVLSVTRPYISETNKAVLLLTSVSTWSGCGGLMLVRLSNSPQGWMVIGSHLIQIW